MTKVRYSPAIGLWSGFAKQVQEERQREVKELPEVPSVRKAARVVELGECTSAPGSSASVRSSVRSHVQSTGAGGTTKGSKGIARGSKCPQSCKSG